MLNKIKAIVAVVEMYKSESHPLVHHHHHHHGIINYCFGKAEKKTEHDWTFHDIIIDDHNDGTSVKCVMMMMITMMASDFIDCKKSINQSILGLSKENKNVEDKIFKSGDNLNWIFMIINNINMDSNGFIITVIVMMMTMMMTLLISQ